MTKMNYRCRISVRNESLRLSLIARCLPLVVLALTACASVDEDQQRKLELVLATRNSDQSMQVASGALTSSLSSNVLDAMRNLSHTIVDVAAPKDRIVKALVSWSHASVVEENLQNAIDQALSSAEQLAPINKKSKPEQLDFIELMEGTIVSPWAKTDGRVTGIWVFRRKWEREVRLVARIEPDRYFPNRRSRMLLLIEARERPGPDYEWMAADANSDDQVSRELMNTLKTRLSRFRLSN